MINLENLTEKEYTALTRKYPSVFWVPNIAQERALNKFKQPPYPFISIITFGNGTGKSDMLAQFLTGITKGVLWVNEDYCDLQIFHDTEEKRRRNEFTIWWVCEGNLVKKGGANYKAILSHIPDAKFKKASNNGVYSEIWIPITDVDGNTQHLVVEIKTHSQDTLAFAGENVDMVLCDEPPPEEHWAEIIGRTRSKAGEAGSRIIIGGTPLKMASYLSDAIEDPDLSDYVEHIEGSLWENCVGEELPDEIGKELKVPYDKKKGQYITRGVLTADSIQKMISIWEKSADPDEMKARVHGKFTHIQGRIYKIFNRDVHVVEPYEISKEYPVIQVVDPHDARPDAVGYYAVTPLNKIICIAEYPEVPFEQITSRSNTIPQMCEKWHYLEKQLGIEKQIALRIGDPNKMLDPDPQTGKVLKDFYAEHGFVYNVNVPDKLEFGHEKVRQALWYDEVRYQENPGEPHVSPKLVFFSNCKNHIRYMIKYQNVSPTDPSKIQSQNHNERVDDRWKDFPDLVRYAVTFISAFPYESLKPKLKKNFRGEYRKLDKEREQVPFKGVKTRV